MDPLAITDSQEGRRVHGVRPAGCVFPCSFLVGSKHVRAGSELTDQTLLSTPRGPRVLHFPPSPPVRSLALVDPSDQALAMICHSRPTIWKVAACPGPNTTSPSATFPTTRTPSPRAP